MTHPLANQDSTIQETIQESSRRNHSLPARPFEERLGDWVARRVGADVGPSAAGTSVKPYEDGKEEPRGQRRIKSTLRKTAQRGVDESGRLHRGAATSPVERQLT
jgi:hypothetical protein